MSGSREIAIHPKLMRKIDHVDLTVSRSDVGSFGRGHGNAGTVVALPPCPGEVPNLGVSVCGTATDHHRVSPLSAYGDILSTSTDACGNVPPALSGVL